jgi:predicted AlkP superfamily phosphohydrolase/phosphomutase
VFERLENAGKRVVALDPPELQPIRLRNSFCASGVQFRARVLLHSWSSDPKRLNEILEKLGQAPRADEIFGEISAADLRYVRSALLQAPARLEKVAREFLEHDPPDCLWLTCCGLHVAGHQFFHLPSIRDSVQRSELEGTRLELARGYDRMIGSLVAMLPPRSRVFVFYAKGMGRVTEWTDLLPTMLQRILRQEKGKQPISLLRRFLPRSIRRWGAQSMSDRNALKTMARLSSPRANWDDTRAFCLPTDYPGFIRFNLAGRERRGVVKESESAELREEICAGLRTFTCMDGNPCVERVFTPQDLFGEGSHIHRFPDLIVTWKQRQGGSEQGESEQGVRSPKFGEIRRLADVVGRSGNHSPGAFAILADGNRRAAGRQRQMQIEDIPATFLDGLGLPTGDLPGESFWE